MALEKQEACQLYIEQEIETGLEKGQTPYQIGKQVAEWVEKLFEVAVKPDTIRKRADRQLRTNVHSDLTDGNNEENEEKPVKPVIVRNEQGQFSEGTKIAGPGRPPKFKAVEPAHRTQFTGENEWYTPIEYIEAAREVLGCIDLDPASSEFGQRRVLAQDFYTKETDGLTKEWTGNIWLNPPYSQPSISQFIEKAVLEWDEGRIKKAIILTHNYTDTAWFHIAESRAKNLCFTRGRIKFESSDGKIAAPTQGQCFFYYGNNGNKFKEVFIKYGFIR